MLVASGDVQHCYLQSYLAADAAGKVYLIVFVYQVARETRFANKGGCLATSLVPYQVANQVITTSVRRRLGVSVS